MRCPKCGTESDFKFCPNCGTSLAEQAPAPAPVEVKIEREPSIQKPDDSPSNSPQGENRVTPRYIQPEEEIDDTPIYSGNSKIAQLQRQKHELEKNLEKTKAQARAYFDYANEQSAKLDSFLRPKLVSIYEQNDALFKEQSLPEAASWQNERWSEWNPAIRDENGEIVDVQYSENSLIRVGEATHKASLINKTIRIPIYADFIGGEKSTIITCNSDPQKGLELLQALVIRVATLLPRRAKFVLVDPSGMGTAFPMGNELVDVASNSFDARTNLEAALNEMKRMQKYLTTEITSFELVDPDDRAEEKFQVVFAANFPKGYTRTDFDYLVQIANNGPKRGTYLFLHHNSEVEMPRDFSWDKFENCNIINTSDNQVTFYDFTFSYKPDFLGDSNPQVDILQKIKDSKPPVKQVTWKNSILLPENQWWHEDATEKFATPIGKKDGRGNLMFWMGEDASPCLHGLLIGSSGSGKSNLFHVLITGLAMRYSPEELNFILVDGKNGVGFQVYAENKLPHASIISLNTSPELSRSILQDLIAEQSRRNAIFISHGVENLTGYRRLGSPNGPLPRIVFMADEYQQMFEGDTDYITIKKLTDLAEKGRSAGIHLFISSQNPHVQNMGKSDGLFSQIKLRMSLQMSKEKIEDMQEFDRPAKDLIRSITTRGRLFMNTQMGNSSEDANNMGQVSSIISGRIEKNIPSEVEEFLVSIRKKAEGTTGLVIPEQIVLNGKDQPDILDNAPFMHLLNLPDWLSTKEWEKFGQGAIGKNGDEGLEISNWYAPEWPAVCWVGHRFSVRGQAFFILKRAPYENIIVLGSNHSVRYGMLAGIISSLSVNYSPAKAQFVVLDRSMLGSAYADVLKTVCENVLEPAGFTYTFTKDAKKAPEIIDGLVQEMSKRKNMSEEELMNAPSIYVFLTELDTIQELHLSDDPYNKSSVSEVSTKFKSLVDGGSKVGIHLCLSFNGVRAAIKIVDERRGLVPFRHRVAMQMSEDEMLIFFKNSRGYRRQDKDENGQDAGQISALYVDVDNPSNTRFMPYTSDVSSKSPNGSFSDQLKTIGQTLAKRR